MSSSDEEDNPFAAALSRQRRQRQRSSLVSIAGGVRTTSGEMHKTTEPPRKKIRTGGVSSASASAAPVDVAAASVPDQKVSSSRRDDDGPGSSLLTPTAAPAPPVAKSSSSSLMPQPPHTVRINGTTALEVEAIGIGTLQLGNRYPSTDRFPGSTRPDPGLSREILTAAFAGGVRIIDTADAYGDGSDSELHMVERDIVRPAIDAYCGATGVSFEEFVVGTKAGMVRTNTTSTGWRPAHHRPRPRDGYPERLKQRVRQQRVHLGYAERDRPIPLWMLHHTDGYATKEGDPGRASFIEVMGAVKELIDEGVLSAVGLCNASVEHCKIARRIVPIAVVQNHYCLWDRTAERQPKNPTRSRFAKSNKNGLLPYCAANSIVFQPHGALGGHRARDTQHRDNRDFHRDFPLLSDIARKKNVTPHALALAFMRHKWPCIAHIVGVRSTDRVDATILAARSVRLTRDEFLQIDRLTPQRP